MNMYADEILGDICIVCDKFINDCDKIKVHKTSVVCSIVCQSIFLKTRRCNACHSHIGSINLLVGNDGYSYCTKNKYGSSQEPSCYEIYNVS